MLLLLPVVFTACNVDMGEKGDGDITTEKREVADFEELELRGAFDVTLKKSLRPGVTITTDSNLQGLIEVSNSGNNLKIRSKRNLRPTDGAKILIEYQTLSRIEVAGAADIKSENVLRGEDLSVEMSGAGAVDLEVELESLDIQVSGAGSVDLAGKVIDQSIDMSGAGSLNARHLESQNCEVTISGVGGAKVNVNHHLFARVSGVGGVTYYGSPSDVQTDVNGLGSIEAGDK